MKRQKNVQSPLNSRPCQQNELNISADINDKCSTFVLWAGSLGNVIKWEALIRSIADLAQQGNKNACDVSLFKDEEGTLGLETFNTLNKIGVVLPKNFINELDIHGNTISLEELENLIKSNIYCALISEIYITYNIIYAHYCTLILGLIESRQLELAEALEKNIEPCLMSLAACKVDIERIFTPRIS